MSLPFSRLSMRIPSLRKVGHWRTRSIIDSCPVMMSWWTHSAMSFGIGPEHLRQSDAGRKPYGAARFSLSACRYRISAMAATMRKTTNTTSHNGRIAVSLRIVAQSNGMGGAYRLRFFPGTKTRPRVKIAADDLGVAKLLGPIF